MTGTSQHPKETAFNFRLDAELKSEFIAAADADHQTAAEVLRRFMPPTSSNSGEARSRPKPAISRSLSPLVQAIRSRTSMRRCGNWTRNWTVTLSRLSGGCKARGTQPRRGGGHQGIIMTSPTNNGSPVRALL
jgi:hypothetical protein